MNPIGRTTWAIPGGRIPFGGTGPEPAFTSRDELWILNAGEHEARVAVTIFYADRDPVGPYEVTVAARRVRSVRFNDLIDPEAIPLETDYAALVHADVPIVVQFNRQDTRQTANALLGVMAYAGDA